ncbi:hypothetical protein ADUPG1_000491, partial [Aduncisulcus paluster]
MKTQKASLFSSIPFDTASARRITIALARKEYARKNRNKVRKRHNQEIELQSPKDREALEIARKFERYKQISPKTAKIISSKASKNPDRPWTVDPGSRSHRNRRVVDSELYDIFDHRSVDIDRLQHGIDFPVVTGLHGEQAPLKPRKNLSIYLETGQYGPVPPDRLPTIDDFEQHNEFDQKNEFAGIPGPRPHSNPSGDKDREDRGMDMFLDDRSYQFRDRVIMDEQEPEFPPPIYGEQMDHYIPASPTIDDREDRGMDMFLDDRSYQFRDRVIMDEQEPEFPPPIYGEQMDHYIPASPTIDVPRDVPEHQHTHRCQQQRPELYCTKHFGYDGTVYESSGMALSGVSGGVFRPTFQSIRRDSAKSPATDEILRRKQYFSIPPSSLSTTSNSRSSATHGRPATSQARTRRSMDLGRRRETTDQYSRLQTPEHGHIQAARLASSGIPKSRSPALHCRRRGVESVGGGSGRFNSISGASEERKRALARQRQGIMDTITAFPPNTPDGAMIQSMLIPSTFKPSPFVDLRSSAPLAHSHLMLVEGNHRNKGRFSPHLPSTSMPSTSMTSSRRHEVSSVTDTDDPSSFVSGRHVGSARIQYDREGNMLPARPHTTQLPG